MPCGTTCVLHEMRFPTWACWAYGDGSSFLRLSIVVVGWDGGGGGKISSAMETQGKEKEKGTQEIDRPRKKEKRSVIHALLVDWWWYRIELRPPPASPPHPPAYAAHTSIHRYRQSAISLSPSPSILTTDPNGSPSPFFPKSPDPSLAALTDFPQKKCAYLPCSCSLAPCFIIHTQKPPLGVCAVAN